MTGITNQSADKAERIDEDVYDDLVDLINLISQQIDGAEVTVDGKDINQEILGLVSLIDTYSTVASFELANSPFTMRWENAKNSIRATQGRVIAVPNDDFESLLDMFLDCYSKN